MENNNLPLIPKSERLKQDFNSLNSSEATLNLEMNDLAKIVSFKFGSISNFGKKMGWGRARACQLLKGHELPVRHESIEKIAEVLDINVVILTQLFERVRNRKIEVEADEEPKSAPDISKINEVGDNGKI